MNSIGGFFRDLANKFSRSIRRFMEGRYGNDRLNMAILIAGVVLSLASGILWILPVKLALMLAAYLLVGWAIFRAFSRNTYKRYRENRKFLMFIDRFKDREHRYFDCPRCRQPVRVPRHKGKIAITCPKCREKFIRKT